MANRFSDIAKQMGAKVDDEAERETGQEVAQNDLSPGETEVEIELSPKLLKEALGQTEGQVNEIPTTRKTTALPLVLDIAIKEVKERRNIASKLKKSKKITEDDVVIEALELYFKKAENQSYLESAYEKLNYLE
jgi:CRISPR/Cas system endoribonuclease Cas6 (RAMP superfamily)